MNITHAQSLVALPTRARGTAGAVTLAVCALIASVQLGCDTTKAPYAGSPDAITRATYPDVTVDGSLEGTTAIDYPSIVFTPTSADRPASVSVPMRSRADWDQIVMYQFRWFDAQGRQVGESQWRKEVLPARRNAMLKANALTSTAIAWRLDVQRGQ
jgi:hypothetical protein